VKLSFVMSGDLDSLRVLIKSLSDRVTAQDEIIAELRRNAAESNDQILALSRKVKLSVWMN
jgi:hypothetical protein